MQWVNGMCSGFSEWLLCDKLPMFSTDKRYVLHQWPIYVPREDKAPYIIPESSSSHTRKKVEVPIVTSYPREEGNVPHVHSRP